MKKIQRLWLYDRGFVIKFLLLKYEMNHENLFSVFFTKICCIWVVENFFLILIIQMIYSNSLLKLNHSLLNHLIIRKFLWIIAWLSELYIIILNRFEYSRSRSRDFQLVSIFSTSQLEKKEKHEWFDNFHRFYDHLYDYKILRKCLSSWKWAILFDDILKSIYDNFLSDSYYI